MLFLSLLLGANPRSQPTHAVAQNWKDRTNFFLLLLNPILRREDSLSRGDNCLEKRELTITEREYDKKDSASP